MSNRTNVLLVVLDSVRAKNTSLHGYERETTPFLSSFADRSTVYTQARAPGTHSIASHVSIFTGAHVEEHRARRHIAQIDPSRTVWRQLRTEFGYNTGLFTNNRVVSNASNLADAFEHVHEPDYPLAKRLENHVDGTVLKRAYFRGYDGLARLSEALGRSEPSESETTAVDTRERTERQKNGARAEGTGPLGGLSARLVAGAERITELTGLSEFGADSGYKTLHGGNFTDAFLSWTDRQTGPWAACINLMDAHSPYEPVAEFDRWADPAHWQAQAEKPSVRETLGGRGWDQLAALEPLYDGAIRQTDDILRDLVADLERRGELSETLLVITSDHGEAFGEQSRLAPAVRLRDHKWGVPEVLTHVPLVVSYPDQQEGRLVEEAVSLTDTPSLLRTATTGETEPEPLRNGEPVLSSTFLLPEEKVAKYSSVDDIERYVGPWRAVYETRDGVVRKYARKGDHGLTLDIEATGAVTEVARDDDGRVAEVYDELTDADLVTQETGEIDDDLEQQLEDLGYIR